MKWTEPLISYLATLLTLFAIFVATLVAGATAPTILSHVGDLALGTVLGGLLAALRAPQARPGGMSDAATDKLLDKVPPTPTVDAPIDTGDAK